MSRMDWYERRRVRQTNLNAAEAAGVVADSHAARLALVERVHKGELSLEQAQAELRRLQRTAKASGKVTRNQAARGDFPSPTVLSTEKPK